MIPSVTKLIRSAMALAVLASAVGASAQSSNATLNGRVVARADGKAVRSAFVTFRNLKTGSTGYTLSNAEGIYLFPALLPGHYAVRADAGPTQNLRAEEQPDVELTVGAALEINFSLAPREAAIPGPIPVPAPTPGTAGPATGTASIRGFYQRVYGQDAELPAAMLIAIPLAQTDTLVGAISAVIDEQKILELPYSGRDVYTLLVLQPGVASDNATGRGLGFAVNGQRVAGTNFLLDGIDNNDLLVTGPSARVSADAVQEYRMTTSNFTAEFGRATAFIANVITKSGTNSLHGSLYEFFNHDRLNANTWTSNYYQVKRTPFKLNQFGASAGGPIRRERLFWFGSFERFISNSQSFEQPSPIPGFDPVYVPSAIFVATLRPDTKARRLLTDFAPPKGKAVPFFPEVTELTLHYPLVQKNALAMGRADYSSPSGGNRAGFRYAFSSSQAPDFLNSPYPNLSADLGVRAHNAVLNWTRTLRGGGVNELKFGGTRSQVGFDRPHPEVPTLAIPIINLPGSEAPYAYSFKDSIWHVVDNFATQKGRHSLRAGFELRQNLNDFTISPAADGKYVFFSLFEFAEDRPYQLNITVDRQTGAALKPNDYFRAYRQTEWATFLQDNWKIAPRLTLNLGLRYEFFGVPARRNGPADYNLFYGKGSTRAERLANAELRRAAPYRRDANNFAPRLGFAYDLRGNGITVVRGGYAISYDRVFNSVWQEISNNSWEFVTLSTDIQGRRLFEYRLPARDGLPAVSPRFGQGTTFQVEENLRTPYAQSWFAGVQRQLTRSLVLEVNYAGSAGKKLLALDVINRTFTDPRNSNNSGRIHPLLGEVSYRGNQGVSRYHSLQVSARQKFHRGVGFQASYTYGGTRDVQSDPFRNPANSNRNLPVFKRLGDSNLVLIEHASFTQQFNSHADAGPSDFDQTHNLVLSVTTRTGAMKRGPLAKVGWLTRQWQASALAGFRSGFPFSVLGAEDPFENVQFGILRYNRADLVGNPASILLNPPRPGVAGRVILDRAKFRDPLPGRIGNTGRNAFRGPGFYNLDMGISRFVKLAFLGEQGQLQFRADFFNLLNHTNLGNPETAIGVDKFGLAPWGRQGFAGSLPSVSPLNEQPRRVQFGLKILF